ncbi:MAG: FAD-linked oxidase C-terminal domain-containing protein [Bacteroidota bacterium]
MTTSPQHRISSSQLAALGQQLSGSLHYDRLLRTLYATDASVYRELPLAVAFPKTETDIQLLIAFAREQGTSLIPRTAGTSLAGQCVGDGIVVDVSRHFTEILELNLEEGWVRVQPGVIRDTLNDFLRPHGYWFGPNTSTANRCMIGGMVGNNSCGSTSIVYGSTREHTLELRCLLSDGQIAEFGPLSVAELAKKQQAPGREGKLYRQLDQLLSDERQQILDAMPKVSVQRRNTGYALDLLARQQPYAKDGPLFNACSLLCGSEGTLAFTTEIKLNIEPLPAPVDVVVALHFTSIDDSMRATQIAMRHQPTLCELMDKVILDCTKGQLAYEPLRSFVEGDPAAILCVEFRAKQQEEAQAKAEAMIAEVQAAGLGYAFPVIKGEQTPGVWQLRAAGLGLLANLPGDRKAVACIEDTAVSIDDLPDYIREFGELMAGFGQRAVYYAHAGAGEIHLRPILDLKRANDRDDFYRISQAVAELVKKYQGSLSGEHGDGRVRAPFIPLLVGEEVYELFRQVKQAWDPENIFNPGKIVNAAPMLESLRFKEEQDSREFDTLLDFSPEGGLLRLAEKCNGSGDCRKLSGTMCPSYQATRHEKDSTRGRANVLRELLTRSERDNPFTEPEIKAALDLCLSCKGCTAECPSQVDMTSLKAEVQHQVYRTKGVPLRARVFGHIGRINRWASIWPGLSNLFLRGWLTAGLLKRLLDVAPERQLPRVARHHFAAQNQRLARQYVANDRGEVYLFVDEFIRYNEPKIGSKALELLWRLGYRVQLAPLRESARAQLSKGLLPAARRIARQNIQACAPLISEATPLLGIEPSAILGFRDEYLRLAGSELQAEAEALAPHCLLLEEFLLREVEAGRLSPVDFSSETRHLLLHGHCHQKALSSVDITAQLLALPTNFSVEVIPSGCCGMAGSFGYEREHYALSQQIGEQVLFPAVRAAAAKKTIVATGVSCRHQIEEGVGRRAQHWVELL